MGTLYPLHRTLTSSATAYLLRRQVRVRTWRRGNRRAGQAGEDVADPFGAGARWAFFVRFGVVEGLDERDPGEVLARRSLMFHVAGDGPDLAGDRHPFDVIRRGIRAVHGRRRDQVFAAGHRAVEMDRARFFFEKRAG